MSEKITLTGAELKIFRKGANLSRDEVGVLFGVESQTIGIWERKNEQPLPDNVAKKFLHIKEQLKLESDKKEVENGFINKIISNHGEKKIVKIAVQMYILTQDLEIPHAAKAIIYGALAYFIMPIDAIPDMIPLTGLLDDLGVLSAAFATLSPYITDEHRVKAEEWIAKRTAARN